MQGYAAYKGLMKQCSEIQRLLKTIKTILSLEELQLKLVLFLKYDKTASEWLEIIDSLETLKKNNGKLE